MNRLQTMLNGASVVLLATLIGCASPPTRELQDARTAIQEAEEAGGPTYATAQFEAARAALAEADSLVSVKRYRAAKEAALRAVEQGQATQVAVESRKAELRHHLEAAFSELQPLVERLQGQVGKVTPKQVKTEDLEKIKTLLIQVSTDFSSAKSAFAEGDLVTAQTKLERARSRAQEADLTLARILTVPPKKQG